MLYTKIETNLFCTKIAREGLCYHSSHRTSTLRCLIQGGGRLLIFKNFIHPPALIKTPPFINFDKTMTISKAQYHFYTKFCSKDKPLQCTRKLIQMSSFRKEVIVVHFVSQFERLLLEKEVIAVKSQLI